MSGWEPIEVRWIIATLQALPKPWPDEAVLMWLRYAAKAVTLERVVECPSAAGPWRQRDTMLGQRELAAATGRKWWDIRKIYEAKEWADPSSRSPHKILTPDAQDPHAVSTDAKRESAPQVDRPSRSPHKILTPDAQDPHAVRTRARDQFSTGSQAPSTGTGERAPDLVPSPPPAEPSGSPADLWSRAADLAEAGSSPLAEVETPAPDPNEWRASEEFQPSSDAYVFDDADPVGASEQPSNPRQIESPAQPFDGIEGFTPSPPPSASPAARPRGLSGEGAPKPASAPQGAPSLFGRTDTAPEAPAPAKAPQRARKAPPAPLPLTHPDNPQGKGGEPLPYLYADGLTSDDVSADGLTLWREWWRRQSAPARTKLDEGRAKYIRKALTTHKLDELLTLIRYAYDAPDLGPYQRAWRGADGKDRPPLDMLLRDENRQRNVDRARDWLDSTTDEATGLRILPTKPTPTVNGRPDKMSMIQNLLAKERQNAQPYCNP